MVSIFNHIVRLGVSDIKSESLKDEVKLINSISFHAIFLSLLAGVAGWLMMPEYAIFIGVLVMTEITAKICVLLLNNVQRFVLAKLLFSFITLFVFLIICWYFGLEINIQYLILTLFFMMMIVSRNNSTLDKIITGSYLLIGTSVVGYLFFYSDPVVTLSRAELKAGQLIGYSLNLTLIVTVSLIFFKSSRHRKMATAENIRELAGVSKILDTISSNVGDGIYKSKVSGGFVYMNDAFVKLFFIPDKEAFLSGDQHKLFNSPDDRDEIVEELKEFGSLSNKLINFKRFDESRFWGRLSCTLIVEEGIEFIVGTISDVTTQQEHETMLRENENQLREAQRIAKIGNWQMFNASKILRWSDECIRIHGFNSVQSDYDYRDWLDRLEGIDELRLNTLMAKAMMTKDNVEFKSWFNTPDGERKYLIYITRYQRSQKIKGGIWYGTVQDFTEQHLAEERILETKQFYESWIDHLPIESVMFDENKRYIYISDNAIKDDEFRNSLIGKTNKDYAESRGLDNAFFAQRDQKIEESFREKKSVKFEEKMINKAGEDTYHLRFLFPLEIAERGKNKQVAVGYSFNITDIKQAELELIRKNEELDRFVYSISHDLRAPVASISGLTDLIREAETKEELLSMLDMQKEALVRMDQYIKDVLDYSRNARMKVEPTLISIPEVVETCNDELKFFHDKDFNIDVTFDLKVQEIMSDPIRFKIIINNLLSNAYKYQDGTKKERTIRVSSDRLDNMDTLIVVEDNGIGIREDIKDAVWNMFVRGTHASSGSGIGLYILKESANVLGASVAFESEEGKGSRFEVRFRHVDQIN